MSGTPVDAGAAAPAAPAGPGEAPERILAFVRRYGPYAALPISVAFIGVAATIGQPIWMVLALLALVASTLWFGTVRDTVVANPAALVVACGLAAAALAFAWFVRTSSPTLAQILWFVGGVTGILALALVLSYVRRRTARASVGYVLIAVSIVLLVVAAVVPADAFLWLVAAGLVTGEVGVELATEAMMSSAWLRQRGGYVMIIGALVITAVFGVLVSAGADAAHAAMLVAFLAVVIWMASSDSDSLALVVIVGFALVWSSWGQSSSPNAAHEPRRGERYYVVLGDSYSSGEGAKRFFDGTNTVASNSEHTNQCRQAPTAWGYRLASDHRGTRVPDRVMFLACSGAVSANISTGTGATHGQARQLSLYEQRKAADDLGQPDLVILGVGGNDAGFSTIGQTCVGPGDCSAIGQQMLDRLEADVGRRVRVVYDRVSQTFGDDVPVLVVPYPYPVTVSSDRCSGALLDADERAFLVGFVRQLNNVIEEQVRAHARTHPSFHYVAPVETALQNRLLCGDGQLSSGINFVALNSKEGDLLTGLSPLNWTHNSLHPTAEGHEAIRQTVVNWLQTNPDLTMPDEGDPEPPSFDAGRLPVGEDLRSFTQCRPAGSTACALGGSGWLLASTVDLYRTTFFPLLLAMVGAWLLIAPAMAWARRKELSTAELFRIVHAMPFGPGGPPEPTPPASVPPSTALRPDEEVIHGKLLEVNRCCNDVRNVLEAASTGGLVRAQVATIAPEAEQRLEAIRTIVGDTDLLPWYGDTVVQLRNDWSLLRALVNKLDMAKPMTDAERLALATILTRINLVTTNVTLPHRLSRHLESLAVGDVLDFHDCFRDELPDEMARRHFLQELSRSTHLVDGYVDPVAGTIRRVDVRSGRWLLTLTSAATIAAITAACLVGLNRWESAPGLPSLDERMTAGGVVAALATIWGGMIAHVLVDWYKADTEPGGTPGSMSGRRTAYLLMAKQRSIYFALVAGAALCYGFALTGQLNTPIPLLAIGYSLDSVIAAFVPRVDAQLRAVAATATGSVGRPMSAASPLTPPEAEPPGAEQA